MDDFYADVILPLPLNEQFTYRIPSGTDPYSLILKIVTVGFGKKRSYSALVTAVHNNPPKDNETREIESVSGDKPVIHPVNLDLWNWVVRYYFCSLGDVMKAALPPGMKSGSTTLISLPGPVEEGGLTDQERQLIGIVKGRKLTIGEIEKRMGNQFSARLVRQLIERNVLSAGETLSQKFKPRLKTMVSIAPRYRLRESWENMVQGMTKSVKQKALLTLISQKTALFSGGIEMAIDKAELKKCDGYSEPAFVQLVKKNILVTGKETVSRIVSRLPVRTGLNLLNGVQQSALEKIREHFRGHRPVLLFGVTASGKTELYLHLMDEVLRKGLQVLYLVPEISLTPQIIFRLRSCFGQTVGIYHSKMGDAQRVEVWNRVLSFASAPDESFGLVLGARSAIFLPFSKLGLIVVDEEHENSYKQSDPSPRYHGRDMAVVLGSLHHCPVLLGTATPSFESFQNVINGKYSMVKLEERFGKATMPEIVIADLQRARKRRQMHAMLTPELFAGISAALEQGEQVILFQNRRGYSPYIECMNCGWIPKCAMCDVSMTVHMKNNRLVCHYCGSGRENPVKCPECGSADLKNRGFGTEKVEEEIGKIFPGAGISRLDQDTARSGKSIDTIIDRLEKGKTDILVGTQMITKGLDLENVSTIGILNADNLLNFPDFRAHERAFQLMMQVSGRSGRKNKKGTVYIQTIQPGHPVIGFVVQHDYEGFFNAFIGERKAFHYPPVYRLIKIILKMKHPVPLEKNASVLADSLRMFPCLTVLGPQSPPVGRIQQWHIKEIWLKSGREYPIRDVHGAIRGAIEKIRQMPGNSGLSVHVDVDPV